MLVRKVVPDQQDHKVLSALLALKAKLDLKDLRVRKVSLLLHQ